MISPGIASGKVVLFRDEEDLNGRIVLLEPKKSSLKELLALSKGKGVIITEGGFLSHIGIYLRELGIPCVRISPEEASRLLGKDVRVSEDGRVEVL